jgi:hypothetical protein
VGNGRKSSQLDEIIEASAVVESFVMISDADMAHLVLVATLISTAVRNSSQVQPLGRVFRLLVDDRFLGRGKVGLVDAHPPLPQSS